MCKIKTLIVLFWLPIAINLQSQTHTFGLRLSAFNGQHAWPKNAYYNVASDWEGISGLEPGLEYRFGFGGGLYLQMGMAFHTRSIVGAADSIPYAGWRIQVDGKQSALLLPLMMGYRFGKGRLQGFVAGGFSIGFIGPKTIEKGLYFGKPNSLSFEKNEFGFPVEAGIGYRFTEHWSLDLALRYHWSQMTSRLDVPSSSPGPDKISSWYVKRFVPGLVLAYRI